MGKTEDVIMDYLSQPYIIADLFNGYIFHGEQIIKPEMLNELDSKGKLLLEDGKGNNRKDTFEVMKKERDIVREVTIKGKKLRIMICGIEQQTNVDYSMPLRTLAYDTLEYLKQAKKIEREHRRKKDVSGKEFLSMFAKDDRLIPTVTIVFYTGEEPWDGVLNLDGLFEDMEGLEMLLPYMVSAPLTVLHLYTVENTELYHSSLRQIFDLMPFTTNGAELENYMNTHEEEYSAIDSAASRVLACLLDLPMKTEGEEKGDGNNMCDAVRQIKESSKEEGKREGKIVAYYEMGLSVMEISQKLGISEEEVKKYLSQQQV